MNDEQLSALMDDELPADASREAIEQLLAESDSRAIWGRYHLIGDALRGTAPAARLPADNVVAFPGPARRRLSRTGVGLAAAAALAAVALIISPPAPQNSTPSGFATLPATAKTENIVLAGNIRDDLSSTTPVNQTTIVQADEAQQRMNPYLTNFNEQRARQRTPGVHPYVRIVGYETH